jgi:diaminohydroxyphosphoribosylaminopyrimidine deaminase / 5-amino-6-(5-phosphoribosylamino)uracil reductase
VAAELDHERWMARALELAAEGDYETSPNPMVGAVVLDAAGALAGEGYHRGPGTPHAEVEALARAGENARGGTIYVTLEPHSFQGRHTPPCTDAILAAGLKTVVAAMTDPDERARGRGFTILRAGGVEIVEGVLEERARKLNAPYVKQRSTGRPFVTLKWAMTIDGRTTTRPGEDRWITGERARAHAHELRRRHDAILVGVNTVLADDPRLTTRLPDRSGARSPLRVVLDRRLRTPPDAKVLPALIFASPDAEGDRDGSEILRIGTEPERVLDELGRRGVLSVLVEGGAQVWSSFGPHADAIAAYVSTRPLAAAGVTELGPDILIEGDVHRDHQ